MLALLTKPLIFEQITISQLSTKLCPFSVDVTGQKINRKLDIKRRYQVPSIDTLKRIVATNFKIYTK